MFEQRPCGDALLFIAIDVIEKNHHLRMHLQIAYIMLLYDIFLQPHTQAFPPSLSLREDFNSFP